jgi:hypothetical protein
MQRVHLLGCIGFIARLLNPARSSPGIVVRAVAVQV